MSPAEVEFRAAEARAYLDAAVLLINSEDMADWKVAGSNAVFAGIAAADAITGAVLGERSASENHGEAKNLLDRATAPQKTAGTNLKKLTDEKTNYNYSPTRVTQAHAKRLVTAAERLIARMDEALTGT